MNKLGEIGINGSETLGRALRQGKLTVPSNQREYAWKDRHVKDLFNDVRNVIDGDDDEYFLGTIVVLTGDDDYRIVVDGQQRLATTLIFLAAVRDFFRSKHDTQAVTTLEATYISSVNLNLPSRPSEPHLRLNDADHDFFLRRVIQGDTKTRPSRPSHRLIDRAAKIAAEEVAAIANVAPDKQGPALLKWADFFATKARIIWVSVADDRTAYIMFETMNDRGLELSATDLIKNYLFRLSDNQLDQTKHHWSGMEGLLESVGTADLLKDYVRHYWISLHGKTRAPVLFSAIKEEIKNKAKAVAFANELKQNALRYVGLQSSTSSIWSGYDAKFKNDINTLNNFGIRLIRPLLMSVLRRFTKKEIILVFRLVVAWSVRLLATGQGGGSLEDEYARSALAIEKGEISTASALATSMKGALPSDDVFEANFRSFTVTKEPQARYLLEALELRRQSKGAAFKMLGGGDLTLEHVLPINPKMGAWDHFNTGEQEEYVYRLGNLALLQKKPNSDIGNESFAIKQPVLGAEDLILTREIAKHSNWTKQTIEARQAELAKLAIKTWPLSI
jgi:Protein of unknown function DUF262/Protein of unknown function (DUF1524)